MTGRRPKRPNDALKRLIAESGISHGRLAFTVNALAERAGLMTAYKHSSVNRWLSGETPKDAVPELIAAALGERLGRQVTLDEIGMPAHADDETTLGWDFPRDRRDAITSIQTYWNQPASERPAGFAATGYVLPITRWLAVPADNPTGTDPEATGPTGRRVGQAEVDELRTAADQARQWDATFGGGDWRLSSVTQGLLQARAVPLLSATHSDAVGRDLFSVTAELMRVVAWAAVDTGRGGIAQQRLIQALRLARAGGDVEMGAYILTTMALQTLLEGAPEHALDMAEGAYQRGNQHACLRVLALAKLTEARAHARLSDAASASAALSRAERLLDKIGPDSSDPNWIAYVSRARLAADACEIFRDLRNPKAALRWHRQIADLGPDGLSRAVGLRLAVVATAHCQARDVDQALDAGQHALENLAQVSSTRAAANLRDVIDALAPWSTDPRVAAFVRRAQDRVAGLRPEALVR
jgi:hypothetical protein